MITDKSMFDITDEFRLWLGALREQVDRGQSIDYSQTLDLLGASEELLQALDALRSEFSEFVG